jgi:hypothetical protein
MEKYHYNKQNLKITKIKSLKAALLIRLAKSWIFPSGRLFPYKMLGVRIGKDVYTGPNLDIIDYVLGIHLIINESYCKSDGSG